jgi:hypothetical protein
VQKRILDGLPGLIFFDVTYLAGGFRKSLKIRGDSGIEGPKFGWSASCKMFKGAGMP